MTQGFVVFACKHALSWRPAATILPKGSTPLYAEDEHGTGIYLGGVSPSYPYDGSEQLGLIIAQARAELAKYAWYKGHVAPEGDTHAPTHDRR
jgi:hypothetical protein